MHNEKVAIRGERLLLVPYLRHHVPRYHEWMCDPTLLALTASEPLSLEEEYANQIEWLASDDKLTFIVLHAGIHGDGEPAAAAEAAANHTPLAQMHRRYEMLGDCNVFLSQQDPEEAEVEVSVSESAYRRCGVAQEAIRLLMVYVARHVGRRKYIAKILDDNNPSISLFTKVLGFTHFKDIPVFHERHFVKTLTSDEEIDALAAQARFRLLEYTESLEKPEAGQFGDAPGRTYVWQTWEERAADVVADGEKQLLRFKADTPKGAVIGSSVTLSDRQPADRCGILEASVSGAACYIAHSSNPTALLANGQLVATRAATAGRAVTINFNASTALPLRYPFPDVPFTRAWDAAEGQSSASTGIGDGWELPLAAEAAASAAETSSAVVVGRPMSMQPVWYRERWLRYADPSVRRVAYGRDGVIPASTCPEYVVVKPGHGGFATYAAADIPAGTVLWQVQGVSLPFPTVFTLCIAEGVNVLFNADAQCLAHSCDPNVAIRVPSDLEAVHAARFSVEALRDIPRGEVIAFNYLTTEYAMDEPFECGCAAPGCYVHIAGFGHLGPEAQQALLPAVTPSVRARHERAIGATASAQ